MAKCKMKRIEIAALLSDSKKIVERLQRRGVVEICDNTDEELVRLNTQAMIGVFEKNLNLAEQAKEIMARYVPVKTGLFDSLRGRRELTTEAFGKQVEQAERMLKKCYDIVSLEKQIHDASEEMIRQRTQMDALEPGESWMSPCGRLNAPHALLCSSLPGFHSAEELTAFLREGDNAPTAFELEVAFRHKRANLHLGDLPGYHCAAGGGGVRAQGFARPSDRERSRRRVHPGQCSCARANAKTAVNRARKEIGRLHWL